MAKAKQRRIVEENVFGTIKFFNAYRSWGGKRPHGRIDYLDTFSDGSEVTETIRIPGHFGPGGLGAFASDTTLEDLRRCRGREVQFDIQESGSQELAVNIRFV